MDTNRLKRFATEARNILIGGVVQRLTALGFQPDGTTTEKPELMDGGAVFMGDVQTEDFYHQWMSLQAQVQRRSFCKVAEEAAYTWFNRLMAIRIMVKNELVPAVLEYESDEVRIPLIVTEARQGRLPQMDEAQRQKLDALLLNDALTDEQFALLIVAYCHSNPIIQKCFGNISDYTELLLPGNILKSDGFIDRLNAGDCITDADYRSPELIGWLYQFYISERKDEVFAGKGKFEADEIPAATQIFTPNWIVKYMVQNTVGRIYLDNNPYSEIKEKMEYLVEPAEPNPADRIYRFDDICDLKVADLACGSGHILNECFDLLYQIYMEEGYNRRQAVENIFRRNLIGVDIDLRAKQLAAFSLLMKACQKEKGFADGHCMPRVWVMPDVSRYTWRDLNGHFCTALGLHTDEAISKELDAAFTLMENADSLGSIMKFDLSPRTREFLLEAVGKQAKQQKFADSFEPLMEGFEVILALTEHYAALVMNPPYMGSGNMNEGLSRYVKDNYEDAKSDLFSVFMEVCIDRLQQHGKYGMINMQSWMFLSSFGKLRKQVLDNYCIESMLHLGPRTFDELSGEVVQNTAFVISKHTSGICGTYFRLVDGKNCVDKERMFLQALKKHTAKIYYPNVPQRDFEKIPGCPIGYWVSEKIRETFTRNLPLSAVANPCVGLQTADNGRFLRSWFEVSQNRIGFGFENAASAARSGKKWFPYNKGGAFRRWYGNQYLVVNWENDGEEIRHFKPAVIRNPNYYFRESISWSLTSSGGVGFRYNPQAAIFDVNGMSLFPTNKDHFYLLLGALNTNLYKFFALLINPTLALQCGDVAKIPSPQYNDKEFNIIHLSKESYKISRQDWDAHETSWDFRQNEIIALDSNEKYVDTINEIYEGTGILVNLAAPQLNSLAWRIGIYKAKWEDKFHRLHANEEELNRQFIEIYGLQDELAPDVPLDEITILQQGEISIFSSMPAKSVLVWHDDVLVKQLISYAVGCMMGRYSIDRPGLILANQGDGKAEYEVLVPASRFTIDDDGIIPLMSVNNELNDHITLRFKTWLGIAFGEETQMENLNFVEQALGKRLEDYFLKDFWKDHKKMYQNRPIYWLFSSKKGAFQCIVYMHRMNAYTAEKVRTGYLLPHIEWLMARQEELQANAANLTGRERKGMDNIGKQIAECREYHDRLHVVADQQIAFDLDDGVVVNYAKFGDVLMKLK